MGGYLNNNRWDSTPGLGEQEDQIGSQGRFEDNMPQYGDAVESAWETNGERGNQGGQGVPVRGGYGETFDDENSRTQDDYEDPVGSLKGVSEAEGGYQVPYGLTLRPALGQWPERYVQVNGQVRKLGNYTTQNVGKMSGHFENGTKRRVKIKKTNKQEHVK